MNSESFYINSNLSLECKLLLLCCQNNIPAEQLISIQEMVKGPVNWQYFLELTIKNRVYPIVYKSLKRLQNHTDIVILPKLEELCKKNQRKALAFTTELIKVMGYLEENDIRAISLKGPALAMWLYDDVSLRVSKDLDIVVDFSEFEIIDKALSEMGYIEKTNFKKLSEKQKTFFIRKNHHLSYVNKSGTLVELHWSLEDKGCNMSFDAIWENTMKYNLFGREIHTLKEEEHFIYLLEHGSRHGWKRLRWLCDVYEIMKHKDLDWAYVVKRTQTLGIAYQLEQTMILLKLLFGLTPPIILSLTKRERITAKQLADMAIRFMESTDGEIESKGHALRPKFKKYMFIWHVGIGRKAKYLTSIFVPNQADFESIKIPDSYFFLYYLFRPFRLAKKIIFNNKE